MCRPEWYSFILLFNLTVFIRLNVVAFIKFFVIRVRRLFEGGVHTGRRLFKIQFISRGMVADHFN